MSLPVCVCHQDPRVFWLVTGFMFLGSGLIWRRLLSFLGRHLEPSVPPLVIQTHTHTQLQWPLTIFCFSLMLNIIVYSVTMPPNKSNLESSISARRCMRTLVTPNCWYKWLNIILLNYARWTNVWRSRPYCHFSCLWYRSLQCGREIWNHQTWRRESDDVLPPLCKMPQTFYRLCSFKDDCFSTLDLLNSLQRLEIFIF